MIFGVGQFYASQISFTQTPAAMVTKICDFQHKIRYNIGLSCAADTSQMLARSRGISGSANLMVSVKHCTDDPCCHGDENFEILTEKSAVTLKRQTVKKTHVYMLMR